MGFYGDKRVQRDLFPGLENRSASSETYACGIQHSDRLIGTRHRNYVIGSANL